MLTSRRQELVDRLAIDRSGQGRGGPYRKVERKKLGRAVLMAL